MKKLLFYTSLILIACILAFVDQDIDLDLWARLAVGSIFFQTGKVLMQDIFAYTPTKEIWIDHEWGSGVVFFFFAKYFGYWGLLILKAVIIFVIFLLITKIIKLNLAKAKYPELLFFILTGFTIYIGVASQIRSQMFTFLFFTLWIYVLERIRRGNNKLIWILPATMLLWVNMHGGFLLGIGLLAIYAAGEFLNRKSWIKYFGLLALVLLVTLVNPYGFKLWSFIVHAGTMPRPSILEWSPISLKGPNYMLFGVPVHVYTGFFIYAVLTLTVSIRLLIKKANPDWVRILLVLITLYMSIKHQRFIIFYAVTVTALLYHQYMSFFADIFRLIKDKAGEIILRIIIWTKNFLTYALMAYCFTFILPLSDISLLAKPTLYPVGSFEFIKQNNLSGKLATTYNWGSYALWKLYPQCRVLIDGRYEEVYDNEVANVSLDFSDHKTVNWKEFLYRYPPDIIVASKQSYLPSDLNFEGWEIVYQDPVSVVLLPENKIRNDYIMPNPLNKIYWNENLAKPVKLK